MYDMGQDNIEQLLTQAQSPQIDGIIVIDPKGTIVGFDADAEQLLGYRSEELTGKPITLLMPESYRAKHPKYLASALHRPGKVSKLHLKQTIVACHKNGDMIPLAITVSADASGQDVRLTGILQDLRKHEQHINQLHHNIRQTTSVLNRRIQFDALLNKYANLLLSCSAADLKQQINCALQEIALFLNIDHIYLISFNQKLAEASVWTSWRRSLSLVKPLPEQFTVPAHIPLVRLLREKQEVVVEEVAAENSDSQAELFQLLQTLSPNGFRSSWLKSVFSPDGDVSGCVGFTFLDDHHQPDEFTRPLLSLALRLLASALARHQLIDRMIKSEQEVTVKNHLLTERAAFNRELRSTTNRLYQASTASITAEVDDTLLKTALISGHQLYWLSLTSELSRANHVLESQKVAHSLPDEMSAIKAWAQQQLEQHDYLQFEDVSSTTDIPSDIAALLQQQNIRGITLIPLNNSDRNLGFLLFYNSLPLFNCSDESRYFLQITGQTLAAVLQHHDTHFQLHNTRKGLEDANRILARQALHDPLTGLANRRAFDDTIQSEFDRAKRHHSSLCLILADIDFFKRYNDHYGHPQGDACLQAVANIMKQTFHRAGEVCCRYGGEEFAIILPGIDHQEAERQGQRLLANLNSAQIPHAPESSIPFISMSLGIALMNNQHTCEHADQLMEAADKALYQAKGNGRNRLAWADDQG